MTSIRVNTVSLAALTSASTNVSCSAETLVGSLISQQSPSWSPSPADQKNADVSDISQAGIDIPRSKIRMTRRVSFNLSENSVLQLPSNSAIGKIASARARRRQSLNGELDPEFGDKSMDEIEKQADRRGRALLPHGATPELLDPGFAMTSLYVKRGHIHSLDSDRNSDYPHPHTHHHHGHSDSSSTSDDGGLHVNPVVKGVLKPFTPSPVHASFYIKDILGSENKDGFDEEEEEREQEKKMARRRESKAEDETANQQSSGSSKKAKKNGKKRKSQNKAHVSNINLPTAMPLPRAISVTTKM
ncbi:hypothetical protein GGI15_002318 [Coemansia interrupta]|uniref:Uncharacterized protein n=1 Tax=Coemansia interrupta TaxID=1126814 RepID=A0A9W8LLP5_9FUNG|nr:hypothetical protein GGI15_002318 [Coemansia interrupta]